MMAPQGPLAKGAGGPIPGADALGIVEETPLATAGGTRPPAITAGPPPGGYQGARRSHPLLRMSSCILFDGMGNPKEASNTRPWEKADLNGLQFRSPIFLINLIISIPIHPLSDFNDSTRVNCAQAPMHAATPCTTPTTSC